MNHNTVYIIDDDQAVLDSLRWLVESAGHRVETFSSGESFLEYYSAALTGCILLDLRLTGMSGLDVQLELIHRQCLMPIVVISGHANIQEAVRAMKHGALDFIEKPFTDNELLALVDLALQQERTRLLLSRDTDQVSTRFARLTPREREVMELVVDGKSNKEIAETLLISAKTVEAHRAKVMKKMESNSIADLVKSAIKLTN